MNRPASVPSNTKPVVHRPILPMKGPIATEHLTPTNRPMPYRGFAPRPTQPTQSTQNSQSTQGSETTQIRQSTQTHLSSSTRQIEEKTEIFAPGNFKILDKSLPLNNIAIVQEIQAWMKKKKDDDGINFVSNFDNTITITMTHIITHVIEITHPKSYPTVKKSFTCRETSDPTITPLNFIQRANQQFENKILSFDKVITHLTNTFLKYKEVKKIESITPAEPTAPIVATVATVPTVPIVPTVPTVPTVPIVPIVPIVPAEEIVPIVSEPIVLVPHVEISTIESGGGEEQRQIVFKPCEYETWSDVNSNSNSKSNSLTNTPTNNDFDSSDSEIINLDPDNKSLNICYDIINKILEHDTPVEPDISLKQLLTNFVETIEETAIIYETNPIDLPESLESPASPKSVEFSDSNNSNNSNNSTEHESSESSAIIIESDKDVTEEELDDRPEKEEIYDLGMEFTVVKQKVNLIIDDTIVVNCNVDTDADVEVDVDTDIDSDVHVKEIDCKPKTVTVANKIVTVSETEILYSDVNDKMGLYTNLRAYVSDNMPFDMNLLWTRARKMYEEYHSENIDYNVRVIMNEFKNLYYAAKYFTISPIDSNIYNIKIEIAAKFFNEESKIYADMIKSNYKIEINIILPYNGYPFVSPKIKLVKPRINRLHRDICKIKCLKSWNFTNSLVNVIENFREVIELYDDVEMKSETYNDLENYLIELEILSDKNEITNCIRNITKTMAKYILNNMPFDIVSTLLDSCFVSYLKSVFSNLDVAEILLNVRHFEIILDCMRIMNDTFIPIFLSTADGKKSLYEIFNDSRSNYENFLLKQNTDLIVAYISFFNKITQQVSKYANDKEKSMLRETYKLELSEEAFKKNADMDISVFSNIAKDKTRINEVLSKRIAREIMFYKKKSSTELESTVFYRYNSRSLKYHEFIVTGAEGTGYDSGCFHFRMYCTAEYPIEHPIVEFCTTVGRKTNFSNNLCSDGIVRLELFEKEGAWIPERSNLAQVIQSVQSLFTADDNLNDIKKINRVKLNTMKWAMINLMRKPIAGFEEAIKKHFLLKSSHIASTYLNNTLDPAISKLLSNELHKLSNVVVNNDMNKK